MDGQRAVRGAVSGTTRWAIIATATDKRQATDDRCDIRMMTTLSDNAQFSLPRLERWKKYPTVYPIVLADHTQRTGNIVSNIDVVFWPYVLGI